MIYNRPQLPLTGPIARADLQRLSDDFTVAFDTDDVADVAEQLGAAAAALNYFANSDFREWSTATSIAIPLEWTQTADRWYVRCTYTDGVGSGTGASPSPTNYMTVARAEDAVHTHVIYCATITGDVTGANARIGQRLSSSVAAALLEGSATLTIELHNATGVVRTPQLVFESCDTRDNFSATTEQFNVALTAIASNTRATLTHTFDLTAFASEVRKGGILYVKLPGLDDAANVWTVYYSRLEPGAVATPRRIEREEVPTTGASETDDTNYFHNAAFTEWLRTSVTAVEDIDNPAAEGWVVIPQDGSDAVVARVASAPNALSLYGMRVTGAASVSTTCDVCQDIPRHVAGALAFELVFAVAIYNDTGANFTPDLRVDTCDAANSTTRTNRLNQPLQVCASGAWTTVSWTFDAGGLTNFANGVRMGVRLPSGALNSGAKSVTVAQPRLQEGVTPAELTPTPPMWPAPLASTARTATGLVLAYASATTLTLICTEAVCVRADGTARVARYVSVTVNMSTVGANGLDSGTATADKWYEIRVITNGEINAAIMHREDSATAAVLPTGYRWASGIVGLVRLTSGPSIPTFGQRGNHVSILATEIVNAVRAAANTWEEILIAGGVDKAVPVAALSVRGTYGGADAVQSRIAISTGAAGARGLGAMSVQCVDGAAAGLDGFRSAAMPFALALATPQTINIKADTITMKTRVTISGYELP